MQRIGFIGLGIMGTGMVSNLVRKGWAVSVWNRSRGRGASVGAAEMSSPRALAEACDVVVTCVSDPEAVRSVVFQDDGVLGAARPGFRYVECSTISSSLALDLERAFAARGAGFLEAYVTGSKTGAENGTLLFMTGGPPALHAELEPLLLAMGTRAIHCGAVGQAAVVKLAGNTVISFMLEGLCEALVLGQKAGVSADKLLEVIQASGFASPYFAFKGAAIRERRFDTHFSIDLLHKDQTLMLAEATERRVAMPGLAALREVFAAARAQGLGSADISAVIQVLERASGSS